jgi:hypothetical protein
MLPTPFPVRPLVAVGLLAFTLGACGGDPSGPDPDPEPVVQVIASPEQVWLAAPGELGNIRMAVWEDGTLVDDSAKTANARWVSRDPSVARIGRGEDAEAVGAGGTWLVASYGEARDSVRVEVRPPTIPAVKPTWRFTVAVGVRTRQPVPPALQFRVESMVEAVNAAFNAPGMFRGRFEFVLDSVFTYDWDDPVTMLELGDRSRGAQYLWLFDPRAPVVASGIYLGGTRQTVVVMADMFHESTTEVLVHEVGHSRGAADMYRLFAVAGPDPDAPISHFPNGIMSDGGGTWDAVSRFVIDRNAGEFPVHSLGWRPDEVPPALRVRIVDRDRRPVAGAQVTVRGSSDLTGTVATGVTDAEGMFTLPGLPFRDPESPVGPGCALAICLNHHLLVEATKGGDGGRNWLMMSEAVLGYWREPGVPYVHTLRFGEIGRY